MTTIDDLFDPADLAAAIEAGYVRVQDHPTEWLRILNYTEQAVWERAWTPVTRQCRGLIVDSAGSGRVVARPWPKFFNHGEHEEGSLDLTAPVEVTEKLDGSLGILYPTPDGHAVATRGSFTSEQALHATKIYRARYADRWHPADGFTFLFEVVYPSNRIVLDYGAVDDLILLGAVDIATGRPYGPGHEVALGWPGPTTAVHDHATLADALAAEPRKNAEGLVVRYLNGPHAGTLVKIKQDDYVALHRIITGLTARRLWERAAVFAALTADPTCPARRIAQTLHMDPADVQGIIDAGPDWADDVRKTAPEEFTTWIDATIASLHGQAVAVAVETHTAADQVRHLPRKDAAAAIQRHPQRHLVFKVLDGRDITAMVWAGIRPAAERPFMDRGEDVA